MSGADGDSVRLDMAHHFELCDKDGDGFITFSQFLRWVELCDLNPEDHLQVRNAGCAPILRMVDERIRSRVLATGTR